MSEIVHPLWIEPWPLLLASASSSRAAMLRGAGLPIDILPAAVDERAIEADCAREGQEPPLIALSLACAKALAVSRDNPSRVVLGADQVLAAGSERLHKPRSLVDARRQILRLQDSTHALHSAAAVAVNGEILDTCVDSAHLTMRGISEEFLDRYLAVAGDAIMGCVGGYQLEGPGVHLFSRVDGNHFTVLGLPLFDVLTILRKRGFIIR
jgi:septum formation protein